MTDNVDPRFERDLSALLQAEAPAAVPVALRDAVATVSTVALARRVPTMGRMRRLPLAAFAAVVVGLVAIGGAIVLSSPSGPLGHAGVGASEAPTASHPGSRELFRVEYRVTPTDVKEPAPSDTEFVADIMRRRLAGPGWTVLDPVVTVAGPDEVRVEVDVSMISQPYNGAVFDGLRAVLDRTGRLDLVPVGQFEVKAGASIDLARFPPLFSGDQVASASVTGEANADLLLTLRDEGKALFASYSAAHIGERFAIVLDGIVVVAPYVQEQVAGGELVISFASDAWGDRPDAAQLAAILGSGAYPFPVAISGSGPASSPAPPPLSISNGTTIPVTLVINGSFIETIAPGETQDPISVTLPARPWTIEARSPSGRVLSTLTIPAGDTVSRIAVVDLSCGRLGLWYGQAPISGPTFIPGPSADCG
jgi:hypothetical protein